jgi:hypothetical protein
MTEIIDLDPIGDVMASMLASSAVSHGLEP